MSTEVQGNSNTSLNGSMPYLTSKVSIHANMYFTTLPGNGFPNRQYLIGRGGVITDTNYSINFESNSISIEWYDTAYRAANYSVTSFSLNTWYSVGGVWDFDNDLLIGYLNGVNLGSTATTSGTPASGTSIQNIGGYSGGGEFFRGYISEACIWDKVLSDGDFVGLAKGFSPRLVQPQSIQRYWRLINNGNDIKGNSLTCANPIFTTQSRVYA